jgi:predicted CxxxxCH...CXXCH cytochrome family protein
MLLLPLAIGCLQPALAPDPSCTECHGSPEATAAPPVALGGVTDPTTTGVGAHARHTSPKWTLPIACTECHLVPDELNSPGHIDTPVPAEVGWSESALANLGETEPWDPVGHTCVVYCHGSTFAQPKVSPAWMAPGINCAGCHGFPPETRPHDNVQDTTCTGAGCHPHQGDDLELHLDGNLDQ